MFDDGIARCRDARQIHHFIHFREELKMARRSRTDTFAVGKIGGKNLFDFSRREVQWQG